MFEGTTIARIAFFSRPYIYLGGFPRIETIEVNNQPKDLKNLQGKYTADERFCREASSICEIDETTINAATLQKLRQLNQAPINSLQYLMSKGYESVVIDHRITLLLHAIEGIVEENKLTKSKGEIRTKYIHTGKIGDIMAASYYLCKNYFFKYHRKFGCEILPLLGETQYSFIKTISDTRNWNSHFQNADKKPDRLRNGRDMIIYFFILVFATRILIMDLLEVAYDETQIAEYYYIMHDWIQEVMCNKKQPLKSATYKNRESIGELMKMLHQITHEEEVN